ncbi:MULTISPECIES: hypothetical protein [Pseudofrankia]|uniref:hypothetical protein n=1 Tax=Pseudofrankia TaxID=2994363 RepID=UPI000234BE8E|nr:MULTISPECIES: hypothetical protein [Pseudofrankia]OHV40379.1 hypothetical protein BCD49_39720 [Pseudofrankia sp. EUN1h]
MTSEPYVPPVVGETVSRFTVVRYRDGQPDGGKGGLGCVVDAVGEARRPFDKVVELLELTDGQLSATHVSAAITIDDFVPVLWLELAYLPPPSDTPGRSTPLYKDVLDRGGAYTANYTDSDHPDVGPHRDILLPNAAFAVELAFDHLVQRLAGLRGAGARAGHRWQLTATVGLHEHTVARLLCRYQPPPLDTVPATDPAFRTALALSTNT